MGVNDESDQVDGCAAAGVCRVLACDVGARGGYFLQDEFSVVRLGWMKTSKELKNSGKWA